MRLLLTALVLTAVGCAQPRPDTTETPSPEASPTPEVAGPIFAGPMTADPVFDAPTLIQAMHDRYGESWYRTLTFTQRTSRRTEDGVSVETWREWLSLPGKLRIEMDDPMTGLDVLFVGDTTYVYQEGALAAARPERNALLTWGFDVYTQPPSATMDILTSEGYDLTAFREDVLDRKLFYVLGVPESGEVWIEKERLLFVRLVEPFDEDGTLQDVRFENYQRLGGGWIAPYVSISVDDELVFWETYSDIVADPELDAVLFAPRRWADGVAAGR